MMVTIKRCFKTWFKALDSVFKQGLLFPYIETKGSVCTKVNPSY